LLDQGTVFARLGATWRRCCRCRRGLRWRGGTRLVGGFLSFGDESVRLVEGPLQGVNPLHDPAQDGGFVVGLGRRAVAEVLVERSERFAR
jgi:hypothetical protein